MCLSENGSIGCLSKNGNCLSVKVRMGVDCVCLSENMSSVCVSE